MASNFIYTPRGYLNLEQVAIAQFKKNGRYDLLVGEEVVDNNNVGFPDTVVSLIPNSTPMEFLTIMPADEEVSRDEILVEPVIAWALTAIGKIRPVTPSTLDEVPTESFALRVVGSERVFSPRNIGGWPDAESWLKDSMKEVSRETLLE